MPDEKLLVEKLDVISDQVRSLARVMMPSAKGHRLHSIANKIHEVANLLQQENDDA